MAESAPSIADVTAALTAPGQLFEMEEVVIRDLPTRTWKNAPPSLRAVLESSRSTAMPTSSCTRTTIPSFEQHFRAAATLAHRLVDEHGVRPGHCAIAMRNFPEWSDRVLGRRIGERGGRPPQRLVDGTRARVRPGRLRIDRAVLRRERGRAAGRSPARPRGAPHHHRRQGRAGDPSAAGAVTFEDAIGPVDADAELPDVAIDPEDDATIFYTSGTTGRPKGALGTQRNICTNLLSLVYSQARAARSTPAGSPPPAPAGPNVYLLSVPFFHATGCHSILVPNLAFGGKIVIMRKWDAGRALELIERERVTTFGGVPAMVWQVLEHPDFAERDISSVRSIGYGGAPAAPELVRRIEALFPGRTPSNGYGLTETSSVTTLNVGADYVRKPDSVGVPVPVVDVKVVDPLGEALPVGEIGELWIKGPNVVKGYWAKPEATAETFTDGWAAPVTSHGSTTRASCSSSTGPRTWSSGAVRTSTASRSRPRCSSTRR